MQISVLPFLVASIISGVSNLKLKEAGKIALKGGLVVISFWIVSIVAILFIARSFPTNAYRLIFQHKISRRSKTDRFHGDF